MTQPDEAIEKLKLELSSRYPDDMESMAWDIVSYLEKLELRVRDLEQKGLATDNRDATVRRLVDAQAKDEGLWFVAQYASEAYLQDALRKLHAVVEKE